MRIRILVGVGALAIMFSGCAGAPATPSAPVQPSVTPTAAAPSASPTPTQADEPSPAQIQWIDGSFSYADPDAGRSLYNMLSTFETGKPPSVKFSGLITAAEVTEKDGDAQYTLTVDEVTPDNTGDETGPGYVNSSKKTRQVKVSNPLILVFPPNVVSPTPNDFVKHLKEFDTPFSFYYQDGELVGLVQWYHP